jgi:two-component system, chemotaxis family, CheB/CheR fusion protein
VFVIPPNRYMGILHGKLHLLEPTALPGHRTPIDYFFRTLAEDQKENAICVVLSGTGTEGTLVLGRSSAQWSG